MPGKNQTTKTMQRTDFLQQFQEFAAAMTALHQLRRQITNNSDLTDPSIHSHAGTACDRCQSVTDRQQCDNCIVELTLMEDSFRDMFYDLLFKCCPNRDQENSVTEYDAELGMRLLKAQHEKIRNENETYNAACDVGFKNKPLD